MTFRFHAVKVFKVSSQDRVQTASSSSSHVRAGAADEPLQGFFRTFPQRKKSVGLGPHSGSELGADLNPWTPGGLCRLHGAR